MPKCGKCKKEKRGGGKGYRDAPHVVSLRKHQAERAKLQRAHDQATDEIDAAYKEGIELSPAVRAKLFARVNEYAQRLEDLKDKVNHFFRIRRNADLGKLEQVIAALYAEQRSIRRDEHNLDYYEELSERINQARKAYGDRFEQFG